jgi:hypothetical protein
LVTAPVAKEGAFERDGDFDVLVRNVDPRHQGVELGIGEGGPPRSARQLVAWLRLLPALGFLELRRHGRIGLVIVRADGAAREQQQEDEISHGALCRRPRTRRVQKRLNWST